VIAVQKHILIVNTMVGMSGSKSGNFNTNNFNRSKVQFSPAGFEALENLFFFGELHRQLCYHAFPL